MTRIRRAAARMRNLINDLLAYTTARDATVAPVSVRLDERGRGHRDRAHRPGAEQRQTGARSSTSAGSAVVHADPVLLRQLLDNLISNAIKYTEPGVVPRIGVVTEHGRTAG